MRTIEALVLILILSVAIAFRTHDLPVTPPGLYPDEAMVANEAVQAWETGEFSIFYPYNNGEEGLYANLAALSIHTFGNTPWALRLTSAIAGIFTVLGTYFLTRRLFDSWQIAAIAAFLMATGFWHVNFSRIGFRAILSPLMAVWMLYFLMAGIRSHRLWHWIAAGVFLGLGMHTYIAFRVMPAVVLLVLFSYWLAVRRSFGHDAYAHTRGQFWGNVACMIGVSLIVVLPLVLYFASHPGEFTGRAAQVSVFSAPNPLLQAGINYMRTLGMFVLSGDGNWRHNYDGQAILFWPIGVLFVIGLIRNVWRLVKSIRHKGHPSTVHTLILGWFLLGLLPAAISNESIPHALRALTTAPVVYIIAAEGIWWLTMWLRRWYSQRDTHRVCIPGPHGHQYCTGEGALIVGFTLVVFLFAMGTAEANRYFVQWARHPLTAAYFNQNDANTAAMINAMPPATLKYIIVSEGGLTAFGVPINAQSILYLTDTQTPEKQKQKNVYYLTARQLEAVRLPKGAFVVHLD